MRKTVLFVSLLASLMIGPIIVIGTPKQHLLTVEPCGVPAGVIVMWHGSIASIPEGWALCDGQNGTPDLRDRFIVGARQDNEGNATTAVFPTHLLVSGGVCVTRALPEVRQWVVPDSIDDPGAVALWDGTDGTYGDPVDSDAHFAETFLPPFYALAFIMKE